MDISPLMRNIRKQRHTEGTLACMWGTWIGYRIEVFEKASESIITRSYCSGIDYRNTNG